MYHSLKSKHLLCILFICLSISAFAQPEGPPHINSVSPVSAAVGDTITITGVNFASIASENMVFIGGISCRVLSASTTQLKVKLRAGIGSDPVYVSCNNFLAYSDVSITLKFPVNNEKFSASSFETKIVREGGSIATLADIDRSGLLDLVYRVPNGIAYVRNYSYGGKIVFDDPIVYRMADPLSVVAGDLDGDGKVDVAAVGFPGDHLVIFHNRGDDLHDTIQVPLPAGVNFYDLVMADDDNEGKPNIFLWSGSLKQAYKFKNNSIPGHLSIKLWSVYNNDIVTTPYKMSFADYDGDGFKDMTIAGSGSYLQVFRNVQQGAYQFRYPLNIDLRDRTYAPGDMNVVSADMNNDGKPDLLTSNGNNNTAAIYLNKSLTGNLSFDGPLYFKSTEPVYWVSVNDMDGDGKPDLVTNDYWGNGLAVFKNTSDSNHVQFASPVNYPLAAGEGYNYKNMTADLDGDGKPEMIACQTGGYFVIFKNEIRPNTNIRLCTGSDTSLSSPLAGSTYQWQVDTGKGFVPVIDDNVYTGSNSAKLVIRHVPASFSDYVYRCLVDGQYEQIFTLKLDTTTTPEISISANLDNICAGSRVKFTATYANAGDTPTFRWLVNGLPTDSVGLTYRTTTLENKDSVAAVVYSSAVCATKVSDTSKAIVMKVKYATLPVIKLIAKDSVAVNESFVITPDTSNVNMGALLLLIQSINGGDYKIYSYNDVTDTGSIKFTVTNADSVVGVKKYFIQLQGTSAAGCDLIVNSDTIAVVVYKPEPARATNPDEPSGRIYPNPVTDNLVVNDLEVNDGWMTMEIRSLDGAQSLGVYNIEGRTSLNLNIATLNKGYYLAVLKRKSGAPKTIRFIKL